MTDSSAAMANVIGLGDPEHGKGKREEARMTQVSSLGGCVEMITLAEIFDRGVKCAREKVVGFTWDMLDSRCLGDTNEAVGTLGIIP